MNENVDNSSDEPEDKQDSGEQAAETGPRGGERLAAARRELQISVHEIAKELHIDETKVSALERNEFDVLGAPVFAKGHLRKYSQLVGVDEQDVFADYYEMTRAADLPPVISTRPKPRRELTPGPWIAVIMVIVVVATAYWWFAHEGAPAVDTPAVPQEAEPDADVITDDAPAPGEETAAPEEEIEEETEAEPEPAPQATGTVIEETQSPQIAAGQVRVLLTYTGDCWTEITDATGRRLFFNLGRDGRSVELSGAEPLSVLFGSPGNVSVVVNGEAFALPADARPNRPLRLAIAGS